MSDTEEKWRRRVASWRGSSQTAAEFSARHGFAAGTLLWWSWRLRQKAAAAPTRVRLARLVRSPAAETPARRGVVVVEAVEARVRITVDAGDRESLSAVLETLGAKRAS